MAWWKSHLFNVRRIPCTNDYSSIVWTIFYFIDNISQLIKAFEKIYAIVLKLITILFQVRDYMYRIVTTVATRHWCTNLFLSNQSACFHTLLQSVSTEIRKLVLSPLLPDDQVQLSLRMLLKNCHPRFVHSYLVTPQHQLIHG